MKSGIIAGIGLFAVTLAAFCAAGAGPDEGFYQIRNRKMDALLRPKNANNANGTPIVLYPAEPWKCMTWKVRAAGTNAFELQNYLTRKTFVAETNGAQTALVQTPVDHDTSKRPTWSFTRLPDGFYRIENASTGQALTGSEGQVRLAPWAEKPEQEWELIGIAPAKLTM